MEAPEDSVALIGCLSSGEAGPDLDGALHRDPAPAREASQTLLERRGQAKSGSLDATGRAKSTSIVSEVQDVVYRRGVVDVGDAATHQERAKLVIIMVGLPGRGKTYLCNKLMRYLNWLGHSTRHFNVGKYRRKVGGDGGQDATFFDHANKEGMRLRQEAMDQALQDMGEWISSDTENQIAIFDATNSTEERRQYVARRFHGRIPYLFIESICDDDETLQQTIALKLQYSPDYVGVDPEQAMSDFRARIAQYEQVYEPLTGADGKQNRHLHFIQLNNMITGRGFLDINRISGYLPSKIVSFLMQVCRSGINSNRRIWLTRHGESEFNRKGLVGGDAPLTDKGREYARRLAGALCKLVPVPVAEEDALPVSCWTSTLQRTCQTAQHVPFPTLLWKALDEIQAGICDGHSYEDIKRKWPETYRARKADKLNFRYPSGESYMDLTRRLEPVILELERQAGSVCVIGHQAVLRVLYSYFTLTPRADMPELEMPLHTILELEPMPDGTVVERRYKLDVDADASEPLSPTLEGEPFTQSPGRRIHWSLHAEPAANDQSDEAKGVSSMSIKPVSAMRRGGSAANSPRKARLALLTQHVDDTDAASLGLRRASFSSIASCASEWVEQPGSRSLGRPERGAEAPASPASPTAWQAVDREVTADVTAAVQTPN